MVKRDGVKDCSLIGYEKKKIINVKGDLELLNMGQKRVSLISNILISR